MDSKSSAELFLLRACGALQRITVALNDVMPLLLECQERVLIPQLRERSGRKFFPTTV